MGVVIDAWLHSLVPIAVLACAAWALCTLRRNAGLVDIFWPGFFLVAGAYDLWRNRHWTSANLALAALLVAWALRLSVHLAIRNWRAPEDRRYAEIRSRHKPGFAWKSLVYVFGLQALLAWIISAPLAAGLAARPPAGAAWALGLAVATAGLVIETLADAQLRAFITQDRRGREVLDTGLWRYSRHPNYFGECCLWWGLFLMAVGADSPWIVVSPLLMTYLLLRVSGVTLLEKNIAQRRPAYRDYVARTSAFFPWKPRAAVAGARAPQP